MKRTPGRRRRRRAANIAALVLAIVVLLVALGSLTVAALAAGFARGVRFEVCELTLRLRDMKRDQFIQEAEFTTSGVVRMTKLQLQGHAYIRP